MAINAALVRIGSALCLLIGLALAQNAGAADVVLVPKIEGPWWQVAGSPDLGKYSTDLGTGTTGPVVVDTLLSPNGGVLRTTTTASLAASVNSRFTDHIFRVGLNYRFGGDAIVARY